MIEDKPVPDPRTLPLIHAFYLLDRDRVNTQNGIGCIPLSSIYTYCEKNAHYIDDPEYFEEVMLEVDAAYVSEINARLRRQMQQQQNRGGSRG